MSLFWSWAAKLLLLVVLVQGWFLYDVYQKNSTLASSSETLSLQLQAAEASLAQLESQLAVMEKRTLDGMLEQSNKALVSGWETLLNKVEKELQKAKQAIPALLEPDAPDEAAEALSDAPKADDAGAVNEVPAVKSPQGGSYPSQPTIVGERT